MLFVWTIFTLHMLAAYVIVTALTPEMRRCDRPVAALLLGFTSFYGVPVIIGWATSFINLWTVLLSAIVPIAGAGYFVWRRGTPWQEMRADLLAVRRIPLPEILLWALPAVLLLATFVYGSTLPIRIWDAASYHATTPMRWAETHRFTLNSYGDAEISPYMAAGEVYANVKAVLPFMILEFTGLERGTALAQWPFALLLVASIFAITTRLGMRGISRPVAVLFVLFAPEFMLQTLEAYADLVFVACQAALVWVLLSLLQDGFRWHTVAAGAMAFAQLAGAKPTSLPSCAGMGLLFLVLVYGCSGGTIPRRLRNVGIALATVVALSLAIAGPWYIHALVKLGNPVYPIKVAMGDTVIFPGPFSAEMNTSFAEERIGAKGTAAWWKVMREEWRSPSISSWGSGLGSHALIMGLPALACYAALAWFSRNRRAQMLMLACLLIFQLTSSSWVLARFLLFQLLFMGIALALLISGSRWPTKIIVIAGFLLLGTYNVMRTIPAAMYRVRPAELALFPFATGNYRGAQVDSYPDEYTTLDFWREEVSGPGKVLAIPAEMPPWYARPLRGGSVVRVAEPKPGETSAAWADYLRLQGATHAYIPRGARTYEMTFADPTRFRSLLQRIDSSAEGAPHIAGRDDSVLMEIIGSAGR